MLLKMAFRNVLRNKKRTLITATAIFVATVIAIFTQGFMDGTFNDMIRNFRKFQTGHIRITTKEYIERERFMPVDELLFDTPDIISVIEENENISAAEERIRFGLMLSRGENTVPAFGMGIPFGDSMLNVKEVLTEGSAGKDGVLLGVGLARDLNVGIGDDLLIATQTSEGGLNGIKLRISGLFSFGVAMFDNEMFLMDLQNAKKLLKTSGDTTEILLTVKDVDAVTITRDQLREELSDDLAVEDFKDQMGAMWTMVKVQGKLLLIFELLIVFLSSFVIVNTMMQSVFERMKEIGTLKALGMTDSELVGMFRYEGAILGLFGGAAAAVFGHLLNVVVGICGINFQEAMGEVSLPMSYTMKTEAHWYYTLLFFAAAVFISTVSATIPARHAKKMSSADALRNR